MNRNRARIWITYLSVVVITSIFVMEIVVRALGYTTWNPNTEVNIVVEPGSKLTQIDSLLGYKHIAGSFHITLPTGLEFDITHSENTLRATRPTDSYLEDKPRPEVWVLGGSFTHGWSIEDYETFPWLLQEELPDYDVINFGVGGYGTIQSLLKIEELLATDRRPSVIVLAYSALHDERNTFMRSRVKEVSAWNHLGEMNQPAARLDSDSNLIMEQKKVRYRAVPFVRYLAVAHCLDIAINKIQHLRIDSHMVTRKILKRIVSTTNSYDIPVVLAHIYAGTNSESLMTWADDNGFSVVDISVSLSEQGMSNRPYDAHPSALANKHYASVLTDHLVSHNFVRQK